YQTNYVDQGGFVDQTTVTPGRVHNTLRWIPGTAYCDPCGGMVQQRGGLAWVPQQGPARVDVARVWQPNVVAVQTPQTTLVQRQGTPRGPRQGVKGAKEET